MVEENEPPDMKVPAAILPHTGEKAVKRLTDAVVRLNLGEFEGDYHYAAVVYIINLKRFILLYREVGQPWSADHFKILKKYKNESLDMVDTNKDIQEIINKCQGIKPISLKQQKTPKKMSRRHRQNHLHQRKSRKQSQKKQELDI